MVKLDWKEFSELNRRRCESPAGFRHAVGSWSLSDWMVALAGEVGEAANLVKKLNRDRDGIPGNGVGPETLLRGLADELADVFIYLDLLAQAAGVDLPAAVLEKFEATSQKIGFVDSRPDHVWLGGGVGDLAQAVGFVPPPNGDGFWFHSWTGPVHDSELRGALLGMLIEARQYQTSPWLSGWYWVKGRGPAFVRFNRDRTKWLVEGAGGARPLNGRQVAPLLFGPAEFFGEGADDGGR